ncbi:MAG: hypothetical protein LUD83_06675 [Clostridiales bacterium]|nr:hypothetical protein [Clostridiales bacterium]
MKAETLLYAIGEVNEDFVADAAVAPGRRHPWMRWAAAAACLCLVVGGGLLWLYQMGYLTASCGGAIGTLVGENYYFHSPHYGICVYGEGETTLLVSDLTRWDSAWFADEYGIYYTGADKRTLYIRIHDTGETEALYVASSDWTHAGIEAVTEDGVYFHLYNKEEGVSAVVLVNPRTGDTETVNGPESYEDMSVTVLYHVGEREIAVTEQLGNVVSVTENGAAIDLGEQYALGSLYGDNLYAGDSLLFQRWVETEERTVCCCTLLRPDGTNLLIEDFEVLGGNDDYLFGYAYDEALGDYDTASLCAYTLDTGTVTLLLEDYGMEEVEVSGSLLYTTAPWASSTDCYTLSVEQGVLTAEKITTLE